LTNKGMIGAKAKFPAVKKKHWKKPSPVPETEFDVTCQKGRKGREHQELKKKAALDRTAKKSPRGGGGKTCKAPSKPKKEKRNPEFMEGGKERQLVGERQKHRPPTKLRPKGETPWEKVQQKKKNLPPRGAFRADNNSSAPKQPGLQENSKSGPSFLRDRARRGPSRNESLLRTA